MSDVQHTPETWWVEADHREGRGIVGYDVLAKGRCIVGCEGIDGSEQGLKDATMIAAAPCMLAALEKARDSYVGLLQPASGWESRLNPNSEMAAIVAAIAKARGHD